MTAGLWNLQGFLHDRVTRAGNEGLGEACAWIAPRLGTEDTLLDAACGTGAFVCALAPGVREVVACDFSPRMVHLTSRKARHRGLHNMSFAVQDVTNLTYPDGLFDVAVAANVLHLLDDPSVAVAQLVRVLKPGGLLIVPHHILDNDNVRSARLRFIEWFGFRAPQRWSSPDHEAFLTGQGLDIIGARTFQAWQPMQVALCLPGQ